MVAEQQLKEDCRAVNMGLTRQQEEWHSWGSVERKELLGRLLSLIEEIKVARDISLRRYLPAFIGAVDELEGDLASMPDSEEEEFILS